MAAQIASASFPDMLTATDRAAGSDISARRRSFSTSSVMIIPLFSTLFGEQALSDILPPERVRVLVNLSGGAQDRPELGFDQRGDVFAALGRASLGAEKSGRDEPFGKADGNKLAVALFGDGFTLEHEGNKSL